MHFLGDRVGFQPAAPIPFSKIQNSQFIKNQLIVQAQFSMAFGVGSQNVHDCVRKCVSESELDQKQGKK